MKLLARRPEMVFHLIAGYCLLSIALRILRSDSLEIDESEQAFLSQYLLAGYGTQPPFYNWLQYGVSSLFGMSVATLTIVKNGLLFLCCLFYGLAARTIVADRSLSAIAMLGVLTLPPVFLLSQRDLSHTVAALFTVSLFLFGFLQTLKNPRLASYLITGIAVGLGVISKYNFVIIPIAAIVAVSLETDLRNRLFDWRTLVAIAIAALIVAPHAYWVLNNIDLASGGTIDEMKQGSETAALPHVLQGTLSLTVAVIKGLAPTAAVFGLVFYGDLTRIVRAESQWTRIMGRMLVICIVIVAFIVVGLGATHIRQKWLALFVVLLPLYLATKIDAAGIDVRSRLPKFLYVVAFLAVGAIAMLFTSAIAGPLVGRYSFAHTPYGAFVRETVERHDIQPGSVVVDDRILAGNLRVQFPHTPVLLPNFPPGSTPIALPPGPVLAVWPVEGDARQKIPPRIAEVLGENGLKADGQEISLIPVPYAGGKEGDLYTFGYVWIDRH